MSNDQANKLVDHIEIMKFISLIRDSFPTSVEVYTNGSCVRFALILKNTFPEGRVLYDEDHAIFELHERGYDITGEVPITDKHTDIMDVGIVRLDSLLKNRYGD